MCLQPVKEELNKETELSDNEHKEEEKLGRLQFSLDFNFTDNTVRELYTVQKYHIFLQKNVLTLKCQFMASFNSFSSPSLF